MFLLPEPPETLGFPDGPVLGCGAASFLDDGIPSPSPHLTQTEQGCEGEGHGISSCRLQLCSGAEQQRLPGGT